MKTYTDSRKGMQGIHEALLLFKRHNRPSHDHVRFLMDQMKVTYRRIADHTGLVLKDLDILIVGPGQQKREMMCMGVNNRVVGIDLDVIADSASIGTYIQMVQQNGPLRSIKTAVRRGLGLDARLQKAIMRELGVNRLPALPVLQMDAAEMTFQDNSFDFVYTFSVFEHLPHPEKVLAQIARVLRPGGCCYISLHMYTSLMGCHDLRIFADECRTPHWPHLRPQHQDSVHPNAYLNKLRVDEWNTIFNRYLPGCSIEFDGISPDYIGKMRESLEALRAGGELVGYSDTELLNSNMVAIWQKPAH